MSRWELAPSRRRRSIGRRRASYVLDNTSTEDYLDEQAAERERLTAIVGERGYDVRTPRRVPQQWPEPGRAGRDWQRPRATDGWTADRR